MKLVLLRLENFQGIKAAEFDFNGRSASLYGDNATGKTTVFNAITWLLYDKPSTGAKNFTPKTRDVGGEVHYLNHSAEAQFDVDGRLVILKKIYHENYKRKRGSSADEFDGHSVDFYVDGVPVKEKDYQAALLDMCGDAEHMKMLTMPNYFAEEIPWDARRKILLEICGDVSDDDVIGANPELSELPAILLMPGSSSQRYAVEAYMKIAGERERAIKKDIDGIPGRIDEAQRAIPDTTDIEPAAVDSEVKALNAKREKLERQKMAFLNGDEEAVSTRQQMAEANTALAEARAAYSGKTSAANAAALEEADKMTAAEREQRRIAADANNEAEIARRKLDRMKRRREEITQEWDQEHDLVFDEGQETCPTCGQRLPPQQIEYLREEFNLKKSKKLEEINSTGKCECSKGMLEETEKRISELETKAGQAIESAGNYSRLSDDARARLQTFPPFESTQEYAELMNRIDGLKSDNRSAADRAQVAAARLTVQIQDLYDQAETKKALKARLDIAAGQLERIQDLKTQEKSLSREFENLERGVYLCEQFVRAKVRMLTERINERFKTVRFRLFVDQLNGGVKEDCEVMVPAEDGRLVPYAFANNAARINAGLEIIDTLSRYWGLTLPVFIDNAESVTQILPVAAQVIRLVVSEPDKQLRLEVA